MTPTNGNLLALFPASSAWKAFSWQVQLARRADLGGALPLLPPQNLG